MGILQSKTKKFNQKLEKEIQSVYPPPSAEMIKVASRRPTKLALHKIERVILHAQPIGGTNEKVVNARDGREQVHNTAEWPNSVHGLLTMNFKNTTCWGTGIMIGPNIVLTAGHNLYDHELKVHADLRSLKFLPGMNGEIAPFGSVEVEQYLVSPNYVKEGKEDYGILILKKSIGESTGYFGLACLEPEEIKKKRLNVIGYPYDKVVSKPRTYEMWGMEGTASDIDQDQGHINYLIDTQRGQSGSGVWYQEEDDYYVCGVHISGTQLVNTATLLTRAMYTQIYGWLQQVSFKEKLFKLRDKNELNFEQQGINAECMSILINYSLDNLTLLNFNDNKIGAEGAKILAKNTSWINISWLNLSSNSIGTVGVKLLAQNTIWSKLSCLDLSRNNIDAEGAKALAQNTSWINLSQLYLRINNIGAEGAKALAQNTSWINLSQLDLSENNIGAEGAKALAQNTFWSLLSNLDLSQNELGAEGAKELAQNTSWINLSRLNLYQNKLNLEGAKALAQNTFWSKLSELDLSYNNIGTEGVNVLAQNTFWASLSWLDISRNNIDAEGAKALAQNTSWINLSQLNLWSNNIDAEGAKALAQNTSWINLSFLSLDSNNIGVEGAKALAQNTSWGKLSVLSLSSNNIGFEGAKALAQNTSWINLSKLSLQHNNIGAEGVELLSQNNTWKNISIGRIDMELYQSRLL